MYVRVTGLYRRLLNGDLENEEFRLLSRLALALWTLLWRPLFNFVKELFLSGTVGPIMSDLSLPAAISVVQTVPAELVVVLVDPLPNNSYSLSAVNVWLLEEFDKALLVCIGVLGDMSSSFNVFNPESIWNDV